MNDEELARYVGVALKELFPEREGSSAADSVDTSAFAAADSRGPTSRGHVLAVAAGAAVVAVVVGIAVALALSSGTSSPTLRSQKTTSATGTGTVTGRVPQCYGPGPNANLEPVIVIHARRKNGFSRAITVKTSNHSTYRLSLPAGIYRISTYSGHIRVIVRAQHVTRHADLPQPSCI